MRYSIRHITEYEYQETVSIAHNRLCLEPLTITGQKNISNKVLITPTPDEVAIVKDFFGNTLQFVSIYKEHEKLEIISESVVEIERRTHGELAQAATVGWQEFREQLTTPSEVYADILQYTLPSLHVPYSIEIRKFAEDCFPEGGSLWQGCEALMHKIYTSLEFRPGFTTVNTPVESVLKSRKGVCQDFAHLMIACLRNLGLPARYVSGYIETVPPPGKEKLVGSDASHAWVAVYFPDLGWIDFDPTNNLLPGIHHITVAYGRDYFDVAPIKGIIFSSGQQQITVKVDVTPIQLN
jgi:transglutaminase-like putative cysteine protease